MACMSMDERFWRHVQIGSPDECWLWTAQTAGSQARYGYFRKGTRSTDPRTPAHRVALELSLGRPILESLEVDHVRERGCVSKLCCNPAHLEEVTRDENMRRARLRVCRAGIHELDDETSTFDPQGRRRGCKECARIGARNRMRRSRGKQDATV